MIYLFYLNHAFYFKQEPGKTVSISVSYTGKSRRKIAYLINSKNQDVEQWELQCVID